MTDPHPQRCETCKHKLPDCDKEALGSRVCKKIFLEDPKALQIGIPYFIDIVGCASHSSAMEPADPAGDCDTCRFVKECTPLYLPPCYNGSAIRAAQTAREGVLDALEQKILSKMLPKSHQWEPGMYIQYDDVLSMMESLRGGGDP